MLKSSVNPGSNHERYKLPCLYNLSSRLFSIPGKPEGFSQVQGGVVHRQPMDGRPEIEYVALDAAIRVRASERVLAEIDREGLLPVRCVAVQRAGTAALRAAAVQLIQDSKMR